MIDKCMPPELIGTVDKNTIVGSAYIPNYIQGEKGDSDVFVGTTAPDEDHYKIWINPAGQGGGTEDFVTQGELSAAISGVEADLSVAVGSLSSAIGGVEGDLTTAVGSINAEISSVTEVLTSAIASVAAEIPEPYVLPVATSSVLGGVKVDGVTVLVNSDGTISSVGGGGSGGVTKAYVDGEIANVRASIPTAVSELTNDSGYITLSQVPTYTLPVASASVLGGIMPDGTTITVDSNGTAHAATSSYVLPVASANTLGGIKPDGTTITVDNDGTAHSVGGGSYVLPVASATTLGGVKIDGSTININNTGVISAAIPSKVSELTNDSNYVTSASLSTTLANYIPDNFVSVKTTPSVNNTINWTYG